VIIIFFHQVLNVLDKEKDQTNQGWVQQKVSVVDQKCKVKGELFAVITSDVVNHFYVIR